MYWLVIILSVTFLIYLYKLCTPSSHLWKYGNLIPGPKPLPILGNGLMFGFGNKRLPTLFNTTHQYGPVCRLWLGTKLFVLLSDPIDLEAFFSSKESLSKSDLYSMVSAWVGNKNMLTGNVELWKMHRKLLTPSFHFKLLENAVEMIRKHGNVMCQQLESQIGKPEFNIVEYMEKCTLDIICETAMGIDLQCQTAANSQYLNNIKTVEVIITKRVLSPWLFPDVCFRMSNCGRQYYEALGYVIPFVREVIENRKEKLTNANSSSNQTYGDGTKKPKPFLDFLLLQSNFSDEEIENEVQSVMFAGHDTSKVALSFCLYALSQNPEVQDKLIQEIDDMIAQKGEHLSLQDYNSMKYLDNVIKETLRMYPPAPFVARKVDKDFKLPSGYTIPAKSEVAIFIWALHNDEKYYPEPRKFKPERFDNREGNNPYEFIPFSAGARNCIGQKFAMLEQKVLLCKFFQKYRVLPAIKQTNIDLDLEMNITLQCDQGLHLRVARRG